MINDFQTRKIDTPEKLKALLNKLLDERRLSIQKGKLVRKDIAIMAGFPATSLYKSYASMTKKYVWAMKIVDEFEAQLIEKECGNISAIYSDYGTPERLKGLLDGLRDRPSDVPMTPHGNNAGHISIIAFQRQYGFPPGSLVAKGDKWAWARRMIAEFDAELHEKGLIGTTWELKVPAIREYLEVLRNENSLPVNEQGKLNRMAVMPEFGFHANQSVFVAEKRAPKLKALFAEFDKVIEDGDYSQYSGDIYEDKLKAVLMRDDIVLNKNLRTISRKWLAEQVGTSASKLYSTPSLVALIDSKHKEIHESQRKGKTKASFPLYGTSAINLGATPYSEKHNRVFSFESLINSYGLEFAEKIGTAVIAITNKLSSPKPYYGRTLHFFGWLADETNNALDVAESLAKGKKITQTRFERVCLEYQLDAFSEKTKDKGAADSQISNLSMMAITALGEAKVLPLYRFRSKPRNTDKDRTKRPSILEAERKDCSEQMFSILDEAAKYRNIDIDHGKDTKAFIETMAYEREIRSDISDDLVEAMLEISCDRLEELRIQASAIFNEWKSKHEKCSELINGATHTGSQIGKLLKDASAGNLAESHKMLVSRIFPLQDKEQTLSNILAIIDAEHNGVCPSSTITGSQFWIKQYRKVGGTEEVSSYLLPTRIAVSAALTLYLCESGVNNAVALVLAPDCIDDSEVPAHKKVVSRKDRAKGKTIYDDLPSKVNNKKIVSAISALEYIRDSVQRITKSQKKQDQYISIYPAKGKVCQLTEYNFRADFKTIAGRSEYLRKFHLVPSMIRPTVLLDIQLKNPSNLGIAQMMAQHNSGTTTTGYTNKLPHRVIQEAHILGYQNSLEVLMTQNVEDPHEKIGVNKDGWTKRLEHAQRTGLGVFCANREIDNGNGTVTKCTAIESCANCKHDRMLISADPRSIAEMIIWKEALDNHELEWVSERYDRWSSIWVPWQALFSVVLDEKMTRGQLSKIKKDALEYVSNLKKLNGFTMPEPW